MDRRWSRVWRLTAMVWLLGAVPVPSFAEPTTHPFDVVAGIRAAVASPAPLAVQGSLARLRPVAMPDDLPLAPPPAPEVRLPAPNAVMPPLTPSIPPFSQRPDERIPGDGPHRIR